MKFDSQKAYPYPVLRPYSDDFMDVEFQSTVDLALGKDKGILMAKIDFALSCKEIEREIENQKAAYIMVFACRNTYFRKTFVSFSNTLELELELRHLRDEVTAEPYIVALQNINLFKSPDINPEFGQGPFSYKPGQLLAQDEPQSFYIDREVFKPITSVFDLVKKDNLIGAEWSVNFDNDHVQIEVSPDMKEKIDSARNVTANRAILVNSIYFGAVMQAIQNLKENSSDFEEYRWAEVVYRKAHNMGIDIKHHEAYNSAQRFMNFPLSLLNTYVFKGD